MTWREYDLTTHSEILAQRPPPPLTRTCTRKHQLFHSPLSCPCPPPHTLHTRSVPFPHSSPPNLLLILHSLQHSCQAVMFFLASPTQCSHRFPLPLHTATSHTPWAQLTHWERRWESFGWAVTPSQRDTQCDCFTKKTTAGNVNVIPLSAALLSVNWKKKKKNLRKYLFQVSILQLAHIFALFVACWCLQQPCRGHDHVGLTGCGAGSTPLHRDRERHSFKGYSVCYQRADTCDQSAVVFSAWPLNRNSIHLWISADSLPWCRCDNNYWEWD